MLSAASRRALAAVSKYFKSRNSATMPGKSLEGIKPVQGKTYDVIVVGLGPAGIAALSMLQSYKEIKVLGLEAAPRTGGRVDSVQFGNGTIDLGAEWCHGEVNNVVYRMVKDLNILKSSGTGGLDKITFVNSCGEIFPKEMNEKLSNLCCDVTVGARNRMETNNRSLGDNFIATFYELLAKPEYSDVSGETADQVLEWFHKYENSIEASDNWFETSGTSYSEYWECDGDPLLHWDGNGYRTILDVLLKTYPEPHKIENYGGMLNKEVVKISLVDNVKNPFVVVRCKDDDVFYCKYVIVTFSLGVLKERHATMFEPPLPPYKVNSIKNLTIGTVDKIFLHYETKWWSPSMQWVALLWSDEMKNEFTGENKWLTHVFGFNSNNSQPNVLCLWVTGSMARYMESLPMPTVESGVRKLIDKFFSTIYEIPPLKDIVRSTWYTNPLTRGSYTFRSMDSEIYGASSEQLAQPVLTANGTPSICFAGEATSTHYYSTVHGAVESGFRESNRVSLHFQSQNFSGICAQVAEMNSYDVIVVGGGIAGLGAAKTLVSNGIVKIKVLESTSRVGGRIETLYLNPNNSLELGAQWIHGEDNDLIRFAREHDLLSEVTSTEGEGKFLKLGGVEYPPETVQIINKVIADIIDDCAELFEKKEDCNFSFGEFLNNEFDNHLKSAVDVKDHGMWRDLLDWHVRFHCIDNACDSLNDLSAKAWGQYDYNNEEQCQGHINFKNGFESIIDKLLDYIPRDVIVTDAHVSRIEWKTSNKIKIYCADDSAYEADHIIVTASLGVLKADHGTMFQPALPKKHVDTINALGFGRIGKIYLEYDRPWWGDAKGFQIIWSSEEFDKTNELFAEKEKSWLKYISGFDVITLGSCNVLLGWIGCDGDRIQETLMLEEVLEHCHKLLKVFTGDENLPKPIRCFRSLWGQHGSIRGGFSHVTRECDLKKVEPFDLAEPITDDKGNIKILFAGEACHSKFFSTVHGAFESGITQAMKIKAKN